MPIERGVSVGKGNVSDLYNGFCNGSPDATFSVWYTARDKYFEPPRGMTKEDRAEFLDSFLDRLEGQHDNSLYYLRIHEHQPKGSIDKGTEYLVSLPFRVVDLEPEMKALNMHNGMPTYFGANKLDDKIDKLMTLIEAQQVQITALSELEDEEPEDKPKGLAGMLSGIMENEQLMGTIVANIGPVLQKIISGIMSPQLQQQPRPPILNGMPENQNLNFDFPKNEQIDLQLLDDSLSRISKHMNLNQALPKLADFLDKNPDKAAFLLSFIN